MILEQAQALAASIKREVPEAATTVQADVTSEGKYSNSFHVEVHVPNVIQMAIKSPEQWNERKHLVQKYDRKE